SGAAGAVGVRVGVCVVPVGGAGAGDAVSGALGRIVAGRDRRGGRDRGTGRGGRSVCRGATARPAGRPVDDDGGDGGVRPGAAADAVRGERAAAGLLPARRGGVLVR